MGDVPGTLKRLEVARAWILRALLETVTAQGHFESGVLAQGYELRPQIVLTHRARELRGLVHRI